MPGAHVHRDLLTSVLHAAIQAPSPYNTQPWRFGPRRGGVDVLLDRDRVLAVADQDGREARIACGAALFNLRTSLRTKEIGVHVRLTPSPSSGELLADVRFGARQKSCGEEHMLAAAIPNRHTNREPFLPRPLPGRTRHALVRAAGCEGTGLYLVDDPAGCRAVSELVEAAAEAQHGDPRYLAELARWTTDCPRASDGVPRDANPLWHKEVPDQREQLVGVLLTSGDTAADQVRAGLALQRVLLTATAWGATASFLSPVVELAESRAALRSMLDIRGHPQAVVRLGYGYPRQITARRPIADVLVVGVSKQASQEVVS
ncbi:nitroreductase family protein [Herbihabitans rhizosphaerae]|uniref:Nitroreductase family protein n=1 Tax=Herbihabitans rhizosphaerae TaxID=1872711 RepID=A0A4V2EU97_9PSEU|nr:nitroreductase [Herbihabitans rhizosphaerae]RZS43813.1 nitroreductase family protein [Herbihabitans rhizosphaerae]